MSDKYPGGFVTANAPAGFSVSFDGTGDFLSTPSASYFQLTSANPFTTEAWIYPTAVNTDNGIISKRSGATIEWQFFLKNTLQVGFYPVNGAVTLYSGLTVALNTWSHVAISWDLTTLRFFINGVLGNTFTTLNFDTGINTFPINIGANGGGELFTGYISNARFIKGTALYTAAFTPPTQMFPVTNTQLLACQSPTIIDNSINAVTLTANGDAKVSNFTPFAAYQGFNPALGAAAGGVWTLDEAAYYQNNRQWPIYDPYFNQTTLMLHGNGTNAAQNNTFLDSSTNNFAITRNGNTTQGTLSPFSQTGWSNYFDGTDDRLTTPSNTVFTLGAGDYTYECWVYHTDISGQQTYFARGSTGNLNGVYFYKANTTNLIGVYYTGQIVTSSTAIEANRWYHLVACRASGTLRLFINGVQVGSSADTTNLTESIVQVGADADGTNGVKGYMSNARVIKGVALYTSNFTPSTAPLTAITGTSLLTCQNNRFVDNSANNFTLTVAGTPSVQAFSPFVPAYITPTTYSNYVGTTASYLTVTSQPLINVADWTVEFWMYPTQFNNNGGVFGASNGGGTNPKLYFYCSGSNLQLTYYSGGFTTILANATPTLNQWTYVSVSRSSSTGLAYLYYNGVLQQSATAAAITGITGGFTLFSDGEGSASAFYGCMSNARVSNIARYTGTSYTPPSTPSVNSANTTLLTCQSNTIIDNSSNTYTIATTGTILPVTSPTPFPAKVDTTTLNSAYSTSLIGGSAYFDGTTDNLSIANNANLSVGTGDFTWEAWVYPTTPLGSNNLVYFTGNGGFSPYRLTSGKFVVDIAGVSNLLTSTANVPVNAWTHYAFTRSGTTTRLFVNGALDVSGTSSADLTTAAANSIGDGWVGYIAGMRLIKGTAIYTQSFAAPISPPTNITNTQLLLNYTNAGIIDNAAKNVLETVGNAQISTTQSKWGGSSMYFDGTGDWLLTPNGRNYINGTEPFTIEFWLYMPSTPNFWTICGAGSGSLLLTIQSLTTININPYGSANTLSVTTSLSANTWVHIAATRNSANRFDIWVNGVSAGNTTSTQSFGSPTYYVVGAADSGGLQNMTGYLDDLRITKGVARYVTNFTPPTSQLQDQ